VVLVKAIAMNDDDNRLFRGPLTEFREEIGNEFPTAGLLVCSIDEVEAEMMDVAGFFQMRRERYLKWYGEKTGSMLI